MIREVPSHPPLLHEVGQEILGVIIMAITRHEGLVMVLLILHERDCRKEKHDYCFFPLLPRCCSCSELRQLKRAVGERGL